MASGLYFSNGVGILADITGVDSVHAESLGFAGQHSATSPSSTAFRPDAMANTFDSGNVGASTFTPVATSSGWAAKETWARHQALIKQLYLYEKKTLPEVMRHMESEHGFRATIKMYKTKIEQWGLDKKNKECDMRAIIRKNKQRADQGKRSIFRVRGQKRDFAEIVRYWNRKGVSIDDIIARQTASPTPEAVECFTPVPSPVLTPQVLAIPERIFRCIGDYFKGSFDSGTWIRSEPRFDCYSIKGEDSFSTEEFTSDCYTACRLFSRNLSQEAGQTLIAATAKIEPILLREDPETLTELLAVISDARRQRRDEVALIMIRQFSALGKVLLGSEHPLSRICQWIESMYASDLSDIVIRSMECMVDQFESLVGPMHQSTLLSRLRLLEFIGREGYSSVQMLQSLLDECEKTLQPHDIRVFQVRTHLACEYYWEGYYVEAKNLSEKNLVSPPHISPIDDRLEDKSYDLYMVARCQYALREVDLGTATLHEAIDHFLSMRRPQGSHTITWLLDLEDWYIEQGRWDSAAEARDRRVKLVESIETD